MLMNLPKMGKVYSYIRFSDPKQKAGNSIERQTAYARKWAEEHGMVLDENLTMLDEGLSAYHQRHVKSGALGVFLRSVEDGLIDPGSVLIVEGLDRLSRQQPMVAQAQLGQIINAGVTVVTAADNKIYSLETISNNPMDLIYSLIVMIRAHEESDTKSKRVKSAIERRCEQWIAGTYRGIIRNGRDPAWVRWTGDHWVIDEVAARPIRRMIELYMTGYGGEKIYEIMEAEGLPKPVATANMYRWFTKQHHLFIGTRIMEINDKAYTLVGYYPPLIDEATYHQLRGMTRTRKRGPDSGFPGILNGNGLLRCGYCGAAMSMQVILGRANKTTGKVADGHRRIRCTTYKCPTGTIMASPFERALVEWCSDQLNLNALVNQDRTQAIRARIAQGRRALAEYDDQLRRLAKLIATTDDAPVTVLGTIREIETLKANTQRQIGILESDLVRNSQTPTLEASAVWRALSKAAIDDLDYDARIRLRQLVAETFNEIIIYRHGMHPENHVPHERSQEFEMALIGKSGVTRHIRFDRTGKLLGMAEEWRAAPA